MPEDNDDHYLRSVTALGDRRDVVSTRPIHGANHIKLIEAGVRINGALLEKLMRHKLLPPIDQCVAVEGAVTVEDLAGALHKRLEESAGLASVREAFGSAQVLRELAVRTPLEPPLAFKMTLARELRPKLFDHAIDVALIAAFLARKSAMSDDQVAAAIQAGFFHDIGELHVDPEMLASSRALTEAERRHIYSHPVTAWLILQECVPYCSSIGTAVLQHHERLDGSGYPRGLQGDEISSLGRVLMLSEVASALMRQGAGTPSRAQIGMVLRLSRRKFAPEHLPFVTQLLGEDAGRAGAATADVPDASAVEDALDRISTILVDWERIHGPRSTGASEVDPFVAFVNERVAALSRALVETGFDWRYPQQFMASLGDGAEALAEMTILARETLWQLREILLEVQRHRGEFRQSTPSNMAAVLRWIDRSSDLVAPV